MEKRSVLKKSTSSFRLRCPSLNSLRLRRIFDIFDANADGIITVAELGRALNLLGLDADLAELRSIVASFIQPGNAGLRYEDFEALHRSLGDAFFGVEEEDDDDAATAGDCAAEKLKQEESDLTEAFKVFDEDGDGYISAQELQIVLGKLGLPEAREIERVQQMIVSVDRNCDGRVDFFEFKDMMRRSVLVRN
ncbi:calcium-binding allergen Bet v 3 [Malania oleifera]|uniref:calcium-binding allergen Bet v 3 n=1 Tax=Malania oleifera TaxID=397392 RepID=UPI0025AE5879|nr:calcium-binding allergen Bet v 3 [Malania oleifera]